MNQSIGRRLVGCGVLDAQSVIKSGKEEEEGKGRSLMIHCATKERLLVEGRSAHLLMLLSELCWCSKGFRKPGLAGDPPQADAPGINGYEAEGIIFVLSDSFRNQGCS